MTIDCGVGLFMGVPMRTICSKELVLLNVYTLPSPPSLVASQLKKEPQRSEIHDDFLITCAFVFILLARLRTARAKYKYVFVVVVRDEIRFSERIETRAPIIILLFRNPRGEALRVPIETVSRLLRGRSDRGIIEGDE